MNLITIAVPKNRLYSNLYILFLSTFLKEYKFDIIEYDDRSNPRFHVKSKYVILIKRLLYIDISKLVSLLNKTNKMTYIVKQIPDSPIVIYHKSKFNKQKLTYNRDKAFDLSRYCFMPNLNLITGKYHTSIFVSLYNGSSKNFIDWLYDYKDKIKIIFYKNKTITRKIGKTFFIDGSMRHIAVLPNKKRIYWNNKQNKWIAFSKNRNRSKLC